MSTILKVSFAFLAGLVVASGLALLVIRHETAAKQEASAQAAVVPTSTPSPTTAPPPEAEAKPPTIGAPPVVKHVARKVESRQKPSAFFPPTTPVKVAPTPSAGSAAAATEAVAPGGNEVASNPPPGAIASARDLPDLTPGPNTTPAQSAPASQATQVAPAEPAQPPGGYAPLPPPYVAPAPHTVTINAGTNLVVRLSEPISTDRNSAGDAFRGTLEQPIVLDGFIIADKGSTVRGKVVTAEKAGHMSGTSELELTLMEINTTDGQTVPVHTASWSRQGTKSTGENAAKVGGGAVLGAIIGAVAGGGKGAAIGAGAGGAAGTGVMLATRGKPVVLPVETKLTFRLDQPVSITEQIRH